MIGPNVVALGVGDGTFQPPIFSNCAAHSTPGGSSPAGGDFSVADFRSNQTLDLALLYADVLGGAIFDPVYATGVVCLGNGDGTFTTGPIVYSSNTVAASKASLPSYRVTTGDFNGDGNPDVLVASESSSGQPVEISYSVVFGNGDSTFQAAVSNTSFQTSTLTANLPKPVIADMNGDGRSDLIQTVPSGLSVLLSTGDGKFTDAADIIPGQEPVSVAVADFNNDGLPDIVSTTANLTSVLINTTLRIDAVVNAAVTNGSARQSVAPGSLVTNLRSRSRTDRRSLTDWRQRLRPAFASGRFRDVQRNSCSPTLRFSRSDKRSGPVGDQR